MKKKEIANYHIAKEVKRVLKELYGDRLDKVLLYGSYARGEQTAESDMDFMVVLKDKKIDDFSEIVAITNAIYNLELQYSIRLSSQPYTKKYYDKSSHNFINNIKQDALTI